METRICLLFVPLCSKCLCFLFYDALLFLHVGGVSFVSLFDQFCFSLFFLVCCTKPSVTSFRRTSFTTHQTETWSSVGADTGPGLDSRSSKIVFKVLHNSSKEACQSLSPKTKSCSILVSKLNLDQAQWLRSGICLQLFRERILWPIGWQSGFQQPWGR